MKIKSKQSFLILGMLFSSLVSTTVIAEEETGKSISFDKKLGNCLACHMISGGQQPGNVGPPLIAMKARFPDRAVLRAQIFDATIKNPSSLMPPFGKHSALSEEQIDKVTDFIHSL